MIPDLINLVIHFEQYFGLFVKDYGIWIYLILFVIIFLETGLVVTPFLPGDSLIFVAGTFIASGILDAVSLFAVFAAAAILGDTANYWIGHKVGKRLIEKKNRYIKKEHVDKAYDFYEKHGGKTIVLARFIPFIRTFAPFVAGIARMRYRYFVTYNIAGGVAWVAAFLAVGYYFGNIPFVRDNFGVVVLLIIIVTILAAIAGFFREIKK
jgi:membrane-associated protein